MKIGGEFPGNVIVRRLAVFGVVLRCEQIDGVVAIGLIETNDISTRGIISIFESNGILCA
jgi:hypothetical protein